MREGFPVLFFCGKLKLTPLRSWKNSKTFALSKGCANLLFMGFVVKVFICVLVSQVVSYSRLISYPEAWTLMQANNWELSRVYGHYSTSSKNSFGVALEKFQADEIFNCNFQWNHLLYRKNTRENQANLYLQSQAGLTFQEGSEFFNGRLFTSGDWESRRVYLSYSAGFRYDEGTGNDLTFHEVGRVGVAPYVAEYGNLHTWLMLQAEHHPESIDSKNTFVLTPLVRIFKGDYLVEFGVDTNKKILFNWIIRF